MGANYIAKKVNGFAGTNVHVLSTNIEGCKFKNVLKSVISCKLC